MPDIRQIEQLLKKGIQFQQERQDEQAVACYDQVLKYIPDQIDAHYFKALIFLKQFRFEAAVESLNLALATNNPHVQASTVRKCYTALGSAYQQLKKHHEAGQAFQAACAIEPDSVDRLIDLAQCRLAAGDVEAAEETVRVAQEREPDHTRVIAARAEIAFRTWRVAPYVGMLQKALRSDPGNLDLVCQYLMARNYLPDTHPHEVAREHIALGKPLEQHLRTALAEADPSSFAHDKGSNTLRIGFISPDLKRHSITYFLLPLMERLHEVESVEVYAYATTAYHDEITDRIQSLCTRFSHLRSSHDFDGILQDRVDVLIDLAAHTNSNHFEALIRNPKLAPVYIQWLGYPNTSGFPLFDYRIVDSITDPAREDAEPAAEQKIRLDPCFLCYQPPEGLPDPGDLPALSREYITLGSFNNLNKVNHTVIELWGKILKGNERFRLTIKSPMFKHPDVRRRLLGSFEEMGVATERINLLDRSPDLTSHFQSFREIDLFLDTFPYSGTTTTFESLLMGCPVVTLSGDCHRSRVSHSILHHVGLPEWVAANPDEYCHIVEKATGDLDQLATLRKTLRHRLLDSVVCDSNHFTERFINLLRSVKKA